MNELIAVFYINVSMLILLIADYCIIVPELVVIENRMRFVDLNT